MRQVSHLLKLYEDARSEKYIKKFILPLVWQLCNKRDCVFQKLGWDPSVTGRLLLIVVSAVKLCILFLFWYQMWCRFFRETYAYTDETELHAVSKSGDLCRLDHQSKCTLRLLSCLVAAGDIQMRIFIYLCIYLFAHVSVLWLALNPLNAELNPICYLLALLAHNFLHITRIRVKSLTLKLLMSYIYIYIYIYI